MDKERFSELVVRAVEALPGEFASRLDNVDVVVQDSPTPRQMRQAGISRDQTLLGLYEGVPLTQRDTHYGLVPPDKVTIFQKPIEAVCRSDDEIVEEIGRVVRHEIAHFFGIGDERLDEIEEGID
ncbi:MAG: metallopeptidase family protein [Chloroflexi bacterium]|nr:metallopeptidase family protein [Chloroflexota bacterium]